MKNASVPRRPQSGAALAIGLVFLVVLSLSLVMAFRASILQERMAGGLRNESLAEGAAESALRAGEEWLWGWVTANPNRMLLPGENDFVFSAESLNTYVEGFRADREWRAEGAEYGDESIADTEDGELAQQPRFIIEVMGEGEARPEGLGRGGPAGVSGGLVTHTGGGGGGGYGSGSTDTVMYYRITARATGGTEGMVRVLESTFTTTR